MMEAKPAFRNLYLFNQNECMPNVHKYQFNTAPVLQENEEQWNEVQLNGSGQGPMVHIHEPQI
jgi:hypothetical protein